MDGLRILQPDIQEFLQEVPDNVAGIFKVASMASGALLYEASREFQKKSQKADEYIRLIHDDLPNAVKQCLEAAGEEFEPNTQKSLLRAASFGRCFLTNSNPSQFVKMCQTLRVRNAAYDFTVGIPLTLVQLNRLSVEVLIDRLIRRREWELAMNISKYLKLSDSESRILTHWACYQVELKKKSDSEIAASIKSKLGDAPSISYSEIAKKASEISRNELAVKLLDYEPRASEQVPLLLTMSSTEAALRKSIESGDTDLVHTVLIRLMKKMKMQDFLMMLTNYPEAQSLYMQYCRQEQPQSLIDLHYQNDNFQEMAGCHIRNSYEQKTLAKQIDYLRSAQENYTRSRNEFAAKCTDEQRKLLDCQQQIEEKHEVEFVGLSVHDTAHKLIVSGLPKLAESIRKDFRIPDKRFWFLKIDALAVKGDWLEIEKFSKSKKSPIGYEPFVHVCLKYNQNFEAKKYVSRVAPEKKAKVHILLGLYNEAADLAFQQKNEDDLNQILRICSSNRELATKIQNMKAQLSRR
ncbi:putative vacuolar protein sorting-associated protein 16-like [Apostichopus japonicus]|uniref:Vacuolar protein sorting-associated protein 16 homolog n=2 Tax=Stichopus japonicus TaxID=307972 RepID=A0A2G8KDH8_STIJA|nr:putative vacuolar protein sorting-associated protein 16-like [Apostichopus japonicus]